MLRSKTESAIEHVSWTEFLRRFHWKQGEHITLIGPTGCGKTTLTEKLIDMRAYCIFLGSKRVDETQEQLAREGFIITNDPHVIHPDIGRRWFIRPYFAHKASATELRNVNRSIYEEALLRAYREGAWSIFIDEGRYISDYLGLKDEVVLLLTQGRSQRNSVIMGTQRPRFVPLEAYDQASHLFFWREPDLQNAQRIAELAGVNRRRTVQAVSELDWHDFVYVNTRTGETLISKVEL